jgi:glycine cleavage system regulatory protein
MARQLVLNLIADDRPGLVDALSQAVVDCDGNWLESRTAHMAGKFAGIVRVEVPDDERASQLRAKLERLRDQGIHVTTSNADGDDELSGALLVIELVGPDHPGIVRDIAHCLAQHGASIDIMETHTEDAPMGGGILFHAHIEARIANENGRESLRTELEKLASALMVDLDFRDPDK